MGYTNYWEVKHKLTKTQRKKMVDFTKKAVELTYVAIHDGHGLRKPIITTKEIYLNGYEKTNDEHETFELLCNLNGKEYHHSAFRFCKTARKPYDEVVKACLMAALKLKIISEWSFDGDDTEEEFLAGRKLYYKVLFNGVDLDSNKTKTQKVTS